MDRIRTRLLDAWRARVHPAASRERVAAAFALIAGGTVLAVLGVLAVVFGDTLMSRPSWVRETGFVAAAAGLPLFLTGLVAGLPSRPWITGLAAVGLVASFVGIGIFAMLYPDRWYLTVQTPNTYALGAYLVGVSALSASATGSLGSSIVDRRQETDGEDPGRQDPITEEEIRRDLEWSREQGWNWGGVRQRREGVKVQLKPEEERTDFVGDAQPFVLEVDNDPQTAEAVQTLSNLQGKKEPSTGTGVSDQAGQLKQLKTQQRAEAEQDTTLWDKLLAFFRRLVGR